MREKSPPVKHVDGSETHPAFGLIGASRVSSSPAETLFGSDYRHGNYMTIRIRHAGRRRELNHDWISGAGLPLVTEIKLSEAQWATFVSSPNIGDGVPCTIAWLDGLVDGIDETIDRPAQFSREVDARFDATLDKLDELSVSIQASKNLGKGEKEKLQREVQMVRQQMTANLPYAAEQFAEHAENTIEKMKVEVGAYLQHRVVEAGLQALGAGPLLELGGEEES